MTHSDDDGLILPPRLAPKHVVILPIFRNEDERVAVLAYCDKLAAELRATSYSDGKIAVEVDKRDLRGGEKSWQHIKKGVPIRVEVGPRDLEAGTVFVARRDKPHKEKSSYAHADFVGRLPAILAEMQTGLFEKALALRSAATHKFDSLAELENFFTPRREEKPEIHGGFAEVYLADETAAAAFLKKLKLTVRCTPLGGEKVVGKCLFSGKSVASRSILAKAY